MNRGLVWIACASVCACSDDGTPQLERVTPSAASHGATVTLVGRRLCLEQPCSELGGEVQIGLAIPSYRAAAVAASDTQWEFVVPSIVPAGETDVLITVAGRSSNALSFEVLP